MFHKNLNWSVKHHTIITCGEPGEICKHPVCGVSLLPCLCFFTSLHHTRTKPRVDFKAREQILEFLSVFCMLEKNQNEAMLRIQKRFVDHQIQQIKYLLCRNFWLLAVISVDTKETRLNKVRLVSFDLLTFSQNCIVVKFKS